MLLEIIPTALKTDMCALNWTGILANVFETHIYKISSLFMGFIAFAISIVITEEKRCLKEKQTKKFLLGLVIMTVGTLMLVI